VPVTGSPAQPGKTSPSKITAIILATNIGTPPISAADKPAVPS
jgi:hypothetical protein